MHTVHSAKPIKITDFGCFALVLMNRRCDFAFMESAIFAWFAARM